MEHDSTTPDELMNALMETKERIDKREFALAASMATKNKLETELALYREELHLAKRKQPVNFEEAKFLASEISKAQRDISSEDQYQKEKLEEIRIIMLKHVDLQQQYAQMQMGYNVFKFPESKS